MCVCVPLAFLVLQRSNGITEPRMVTADDCELLQDGWEVSLGHL